MTFGEMTANMAQRLPPALQNHKTLRQVIGGAGLLAGVGAGIAGYAIFREPLRVQMDHLTITLPNGHGYLPKAGLRILHLSDTHFRGENWREQAKIDCILRACARLDYDLLIHTGDFLHYDSGLPNVLALLDSLPRPRLGAYAVFGNHDYTTYSHKDMLKRAWARFYGLDPRATKPLSPVDRVRLVMRFWFHFFNAPLDLKRTGHNDIAALEEALAQRNIQTLHNRGVRLCHRPQQPDGVDIYLAGVDDCTEGMPELQQALCDIPQDAPTILLSHNPDIIQEPEIDQVDLVLAGHTHGGQVVLPWVGAAHTQSTSLRRSEVSGYLQRGRTQVYITRGIGEGIPIRLGAAPQITLLTVLPG